MEAAAANGNKNGASAGAANGNAQEANAPVAETFGEETEMVWPVEGDVLKPFSTDNNGLF